MSECSVVSNSLQPYGLLPTRLPSPWDFPGKNTGMGCHALLHRIFLTQGSNPHLLHLLHWQVGFFFLTSIYSTHISKPEAKIISSYTLIRIIYIILQSSFFLAFTTMLLNICQQILTPVTTWYDKITPRDMVYIQNSPFLGQKYTEKLVRIVGEGRWGLYH